MRTLRLSLAGTVIVVLLGGLGGAVVAEEYGPVTWTYVTGTVIDEGDWQDPNPDHDWTSSIEHAPGMSREMSIEWSDPRLPATSTSVSNMDIHHGTDSMADWLVVWTMAEGEQGAGGTWTGTGSGFVEADHGGVGVLLYTGHGAYEGLSAILSQKDVGDVTTYEGYIIEGPLPQLPDVPAAID
jgi:hypothetical protein